MCVTLMRILFVLVAMAEADLDCTGHNSRTTATLLGFKSALMSVHTQPPVAMLMIMVARFIHVYRCLQVD